MARPIEEHLINRLIAELCHARNEEAGVVEEAHRLAEAAPLPYTEDKMKAFCVAGDKMRAAHARKMDAWDRIRNVVAPPGFALDDFGNHPVENAEPVA